MVRSTPLLCCLLLLLITAVVFWPVTRNDFTNWDDKEHIARNPDFNPVRWRRIAQYWCGPYDGSLYPVSYTLFAGVAEVARLRQPDNEGNTIDPHVFHAVGIVLHAVCVGLVFAILILLTRRAWPAFFGALLFAVHPVQVEAVAWAAGMNTSLAAVFGLAAILQYLRYATATVERTSRVRLRGVWLYTSGTVAFVLALLAKPSAVVVPVVASVLDRVLLGRPMARVLRSLAPWLALAVPFMLITRHLQRADLVTPTPFWTRPLIAFDAIAFYMWKLAWPAHLLVDYGRPPQRVLEGKLVYVIWVPVVLSGIVIWRCRVRWPWVWAAALAFVAGLLPVLGLTPFNGQTMSTVSDRFLYLSMLAPAMLTARFLATRNRPALAYAAASVVVALLAVRSHARTFDWRDETTLFTRELAINPDSLPAHEVLGSAAAARDDYDAAVQHYLAALRTKKDDPRLYYNLGNALLRSGRSKAAIPSYQAALHLDRDNPSIHYNLGLALYLSGRGSEAEQELGRALAIDPTFASARTMLTRLREATTSPAPSTVPQ